jgi:plasmid stability protein
MRALVERMLSAAGQEICNVDKAAAAAILVRAATVGRDGESEWKTALEMLRASPATQDQSAR